MCNQWSFRKATEKSNAQKNVDSETEKKLEEEKIQI